LGNFRALLDKLARSLGIECEIELIFPTKFETRFADGVVAILRAGMRVASLITARVR
jgi:hypothetical protein